jgi:hypothetical protein
MFKPLTKVVRNEVESIFMNGQLECWAVSASGGAIRVARLDDVGNLNEALAVCRQAGAGDYHLCDETGARLVIRLERQDVFQIASDLCAA